MSDVVARAKAALEGVTEGPWRTEPGDQADDAAVFSEVGPSLFWCPDCGTNAESGGREANFIVAARVLVPELVAEVERLRALARNWQLEAVSEVDAGAATALESCAFEVLEQGVGTRGDQR